MLEKGETLFSMMFSKAFLVKYNCTYTGQLLCLGLIRLFLPISEFSDYHWNNYRGLFDLKYLMVLTAEHYITEYVIETNDTNTKTKIRGWINI